MIAVVGTDPSIREQQSCCTRHSCQLGPSRNTFKPPVERATLGGWRGGAPREAIRGSKWCTKASSLGWLHVAVQAARGAQLQNKKRPLELHYRRPTDHPTRNDWPGRNSNTTITLESSTASRVFNLTIRPLPPPAQLETHQEKYQQRGARVPNFRLLAALDGNPVRTDMPLHGANVAEAESTQHNYGTNSHDDELLVEVDPSNETHGGQGPRDVWS